MCTGSMMAQFPSLLREARQRYGSSHSIPLMMLRFTIMLKTAGRNFNPGRKRRWKNGRRSIRAKSRQRNWNLSMDGLMMTENPDTSIYAKQLAEMTAEEPDPQKELLYEKLSELPDADQELYRLYFIEGYTQEEIAEMKGVSQNTISKKIRRITKQLTEMCRNAV